MSIPAVILRNAHICIGKMNTVYILIIMIINFSSLFSLCYIFVLLCVVSFLHINQPINQLFSTSVTLEMLKVNKSLHYGGFSGWDVYFCCMSDWTTRYKIFFCLWILISVLLTYLLRYCAIAQLSSQLKTTLLHIS